MKPLSRQRRPVAGNPLLQAAEPVFALLLRCDAQGSEPPEAKLAARVDAALARYPADARRLGANDASVHTATLLLQHVTERAGLGGPGGLAGRAGSQTAGQTDDRTQSGTHAETLSSTPSASLPSAGNASSELLQFFACCADLVPPDQVPPDQTAPPGRAGHASMPSTGTGPANVIGHSLIAALPRPRALSPAGFPVEVDDRRRRHAPLWTVAAVVGGLLLATHTALEFALEARVEPLFVQLQYVGRPPETSDGQPCGSTTPCNHGAVPGSANGNTLVAAGDSTR